MNREKLNSVFKEQLSHLEEREITNLVRIYYEDVPNIQSDRLSIDINKLKSGVPIQYVTGTAFFLDYKFKVSPAVLIPRPETEELVAWIYEDYKGNKDDLRCLDVGTGSGIIPISIKLKFQNWDVQGTDISEEALDIAQENADGLNAEVKFAQADFLKNEEWLFGDIDVLISNPPYIPFAEAEKMGETVLKHEPHIALFVNEPMVFYNALCEFSKLHLNVGGTVYAELNEYQAEETKQLFQGYFSEVEIRKDLQGKSRMLKASLLLS